MRKLRELGLNPRALGTNPRAMSKKTKAITVGESEYKCRQCHCKMIVRKHKEITNKLRKQYYYFTQWDYCGTCNKVFFNEEFKKLNPKGMELEEHTRQQVFLKSIS